MQEIRSSFQESYTVCFLLPTVLLIRFSCLLPPTPSLSTGLASSLFSPQGLCTCSLCLRYFFFVYRHDSLSFLLQVFTQISSFVEVDTNQMTTDKDFLFRACHNKGVSHHHLHFGRGSKAGRRVGKLWIGNSDGFKCA